MAIEKKEEQEEKTETPEKGKGIGIVKWLIILFVLFMFLIGIAIGGVFLYSKVLAPSLGLPPLFGSAGSDATPQEQKKEEKIGVVFPLPSFIVNLAGANGERFIKVTMQLEMSNKDLREELTNRLPQIQDHIIIVLSSKKMKEVVSAEGKFKLKETILSRINMMLASGSVKNIYFTEFVVQ